MSYAVTRGRNTETAARRGLLRRYAVTRPARMGAGAGVQARVRVGACVQVWVCEVRVTA